MKPARDVTEKLIQDYLARGGRIRVCLPVAAKGRIPGGKVMIGLLPLRIMRATATPRYRRR